MLFSLSQLYKNVSLFVTVHAHSVIFLQSQHLDVNYSSYKDLVNTLRPDVVLAFS